MPNIFDPTGLQTLIWVVAIGALIACVLLYFLPYHIAKKRGKRDKQAIFWMNLLLGWTFLGWVATLIWAVTKDASVQVSAYQQPPPPM
jgi:4-hydroxybenzoate polyprenyltransferase